MLQSLTSGRAIGTIHVIGKVEVLDRKEIVPFVSKNYSTFMVFMPWYKPTHVIVDSSAAGADQKITKRREHRGAQYPKVASSKAC